MTKGKIASAYTKGEEDRHHTMQIRGVDPKHPTYAFGRALDDMRKVKSFVNHPETKTHHVSIKGVYGAKAKAKVHGEIKNLLGLGPHDEYHASWNDGRNTKDDSVKVSYRQNTSNESFVLDESGKPLSAAYARKMAAQGDKASMDASDKDDIAGAIRGIATRQNALKRGAKAIAADHDKKSMAASDKEDIAGAIRHIAARNRALKQESVGTQDMPIMERIDIALIAKEHDVTFDEAKTMYAKMRLAKKYATGGVKKQVDRIGKNVGKRAADIQRKHKLADAVWSHHVDNGDIGSKSELSAYSKLQDMNAAGNKVYKQDKRVRKIIGTGNNKSARYLDAKIRAGNTQRLRESNENLKPEIDYAKQAEEIGKKVEAIVKAQADRYMRDGMDKESRKTLKEGYYDASKPGKKAWTKPRSRTSELTDRESRIGTEKARRMKSAKLQSK